MARALLCATLATGLLAALVPLEEDGPWIELRSPVALVYANGDAPSTRRVLTRFELLRAAFAATLPATRLEGEPPLRVVVARDEESLKTLAPAWWEGEDELRPSSIHLFGHDHLFVLIRSDLPEDDDQGFHAAYWGLVSRLLDLNLPGLPAWARQGLADFYATSTVRRGQVLVGRAAVTHVHTLRRRGLLPVGELLAGERPPGGPADAARRRRFDAQSWALVHYLMLGDDGGHRPRLSRFLLLVSEGRLPGEAARTAFGDFSEVDAGLADYVNHSVFDTQALELPWVGPAETGPSRSLSPAEVLTLRGAIHVASERFPDARDCLEAALRLDPDLAWAHETRAALAWADDDPVAARAAVERALALDPDRPGARRLERRVSGPPTIGGARHLCEHDGDLEACALLGAWLLDGEGTPPDAPGGLAALERACDGGLVVACRSLSWRFREGEGLPPDRVRAVELLEKACRAGDGQACLAAAGDHREGRGVPVDLAAAVRMLEAACTRGESMGCVALAWALQKGEGVKRDVERAAALYQDQCQAGNGSCCTRLGLLHVDAEGLPANLRRAREFLARGCALGDPAGCSSLKVLEASGTTPPGAPRP